MVESAAEACTSHTQCLSNCCKQGLCASPKLHDFCSHAMQNCPKPLICNAHSLTCTRSDHVPSTLCHDQNDCLFDEYCAKDNDGKCKRRLARNSYCSNDAQCQHGLACHRAACVPRCLPNRSDRLGCEDGYTCTVVQQDHLCLPPHKDSPTEGSSTTAGRSYEGLGLSLLPALMGLFLAIIFLLGLSLLMINLIWWWRGRTRNNPVRIKRKASNAAGLMIIAPYDVDLPANDSPPPYTAQSGPVLALIHPSLTSTTTLPAYNYPSTTTTTTFGHETQSYSNPAYSHML